MAIIGDALRQAFMPKNEYESLREEDKAWLRLRKPLLVFSVTLIATAVLVSTLISFKIVFPEDPAWRPFCGDLRIQPLSINITASSAASTIGSESDGSFGAFYLTNQETVDYYWMVVFIPSFVVFSTSAVYLVAGIIVAYSAPTRHGCLKVVENSYCASRRGGVRCLSILNTIFATIFGTLALFLGSTLLTLGSSCALPLFWCYETSSCGLVILYGGTAFFLRRKAGESEFGGHDNLGLEMLEAHPVEITPDTERRVHEGFKAWMGPSVLSSDEDEDEEADEYREMPTLPPTDSSHERT